ncbi:MAG: hypothetical protein LAO79_03185 [Acidobacteriia bacterium]|nr:hypothetical protein [Terriglobia bacterium]
MDNLNLTACDGCRSNFPDASPCDMAHIHYPNRDALVAVDYKMVGNPCPFVANWSDFVTLARDDHGWVPEATKGKSYDVREIMHKIGYGLTHAGKTGAASMADCKCVDEDGHGNRVRYVGLYVSSYEKLPQLVFVRSRRTSHQWAQYVATVDSKLALASVLSPTDWEVNTSGGVDLSSSLTKKLPLSLTHTEIYVKKARSPHVLKLSGSGYSLNWGPKQLSFLLGASFSKADWWSAGTRVYRGPMGPNPVQEKGFEGPCLILGIGGAVLKWGKNVSLMFFNVNRLALAGGALLGGAFASCSALGVLAGDLAAPIAAGGVSGTMVTLKRS